MILVIGGGALGITFATRLHRAGVATKLAVRSEELIDKIRRGKFLFHDGAPHKIDVPLLSPIEARREKADFILIAVKAYDMEGVIEDYRDLLECSELIVGLQNGMGAQEKLRAIVADEKIGILVTSEGATKTENSVRHYRGKRNFLGYLKGKSDRLLLNFAGDLERAGIDVEVVDDITPYRWAKLLINSAINPLTTLVRKPNGYLMESPYLRGLTIDLLEEGARLLSLEGIELPFSDPRAELLRVIEKTRKNLSSMLQDVMRGKKTEIDFLNGVLLAKAREKGKKLLRHEVIYNLVKSLEPQS